MNFFQKSISDPKHKTNEHHRIPQFVLVLSERFYQKKRNFEKI